MICLSLKQPPEAVLKCERRERWKRRRQTSKTQHSQDRRRSSGIGSSNSLKFNFAQSPLRKKEDVKPNLLKRVKFQISPSFPAELELCRVQIYSLKLVSSPLCPLRLLETCYHLIQNHKRRKLVAKATLLFHLSGWFCDFSGWLQGSSSKTNTSGKQRGCVKGRGESWRRTALHNCR